MSRGNLRDYLTDYYAGQPLRPETAERLQALAQADRAAERIRQHPRLWSQRLIGMAAALAVIFSGASLYVVMSRDHVSSTVFEEPGQPLWPVANRGVPRLVAVKFEIDGCPMAARAEPVFTELVDEYADRPVLFARYDMTNANTRKLSQNVASGLGIAWAYQGASQSGTILLIDRELGEVLDKATQRNELPHLRQTLDRLLN